MEVIDGILDSSSVLIESLTVQGNGSHLETIKKYIDDRISSKEKIPKVPIEFKPGLDWINVTEALSFACELKGKLVVLDFFTYCCINCMHILPQLKALEQKFSVEDGLVVISVHSPKFPNEHSTENVNAAVKRYEITHPVVNDHEEHLWTTLGICCWPTLVIIGPDGELLLYLLGESHEKLLHLFVEESLALFKSKYAISPHPIPEIRASFQSLVPQSLYYPGKVCVCETPTGPLLAIADTGHHRILILEDSGKVLHTVGGTKSGFQDGSFAEARFHAPQGVAFADPTTLFVADTENHALRKVDLRSDVVTTVAGNGSQGDDRLGGGVGRDQCLSSPWDVEVLNPSVLLIAMAGCHQIWAYFLKDTTYWKNKKYEAGSCSAVAGSGKEENRNNAYPQSAGFAQPSGLSLAPDRQIIYVADSESSTVRAISTVDGKVTPVVGGKQDPQNLFVFGDVDGCGVDARLQHPLGVAWSEHKQALYICDSYNHKLKVVNPTTRHCSSLTIKDLKLSEPGGLCAFKELLYIADTNNHCIKVVNTDDNSAKTMQIHFKKSKESVGKPQELRAVREELVTMNCSGGVLELSVRVQCSPDVKPLEDSPAQWTLSMPDNWKEIETRELDRDIAKHWTITVPSTQSSVKLQPQCRLFFCHNNLCSTRVLPFTVNVVFNSDAPTTLPCNIIHEFSCS